MTDTKHFRQLIQQRLQVLTDDRQGATDGTDTVELDQTRVGRLSRMDALQVQQMQLALSRRQQIEIAALGHALKRLDSGEFGECFECGEEINPRRLEIDLAATLCIGCAGKRES